MPKLKAARRRRPRPAGSATAAALPAAAAVVHACGHCQVSCRSASDLLLHEQGKRHGEALRRLANRRASAAAAAAAASAAPAPAASPAAARPQSQSSQSTVRAVALAPDVTMLRHADPAAGMLEVLDALLMSAPPAPPGAASPAAGASAAAGSSPACASRPQQPGSPASLPPPLSDHIVMDLPYFLALGADYRQQWDALAFVAPGAGDEGDFYAGLAQRLGRVLPAAGWAVLFCNDRHAYLLEQALRTDGGFVFVDHLFWVKDQSFSAPRCGFHNLVERIVVASRQRQPAIHHASQHEDAHLSASDRPGNVLHEPAVPPERKLRVGGLVEKCEKPVPLLRRLLRLFARPGQRVADLCAGSAPIVAAARAEGMQAVIFDKRQDFAQQAAALRLGPERELAV